LEQFTVKLDSHLDRVIRPNPAFKRPGRQYGQIVCLAQLVSSHDKPFRNRSRPCSDITNPLKLSLADLYLDGSIDRSTSRVVLTKKSPTKLQTCCCEFGEFIAISARAAIWPGKSGAAESKRTLRIALF